MPNVQVKPRASECSTAKRRSESFGSSSTESTDPPATPADAVLALKGQPGSQDSDVPKDGLSAAQLAELQADWSAFAWKVLIPAQRRAREREAKRAALQSQRSWGAAQEASLPPSPATREREAAALQASWAKLVRETLIPAREAARILSGESSAPPARAPPNVRPHKLRLRVTPPPPLDMALVREEEGREAKDRDYVILVGDD